MIFFGVQEGVRKEQKCAKGVNWKLVMGKMSEFLELSGYIPLSALSKLWACSRANKWPKVLKIAWRDIECPLA